MAKLSYLSPKVVTQESPIHGRGLFAAEPIDKDEIVAVKGGYIFNRRQLNSMPEWFQSAEVQIAEDLFIGPVTVDEREGSMLFSNHSCEPNIGVQGQIVFVAMRSIEAGEELTHDWATTDDDTYLIECRCGSESCRKVLTGKDWQRKDLQEKYKGYISWYLEVKIRQRD